MTTELLAQPHILVIYLHRVCLVDMLSVECYRSSKIKG